jgi:hypothetical protein
MQAMTSAQIGIVRLEHDLDVLDLDHPSWQAAAGTSVVNYWSGQAAPPSRHFVAKLLWSTNSLYVRFEAEQHEPLVVNNEPNITRKTLGLWDRDVSELFIAPDPGRRQRYFEFEVAPTGEWVDLAILASPGGRETDESYSSGMRTAVRVGDTRVLMAMKIDWHAFGKTPEEGDVWTGNLFRCVGSGSTRGYLAWQPTATPTPNFHVPERFGEFVFVR